MEPLHAAVADQLDRHQQRRSQGIATVSVLRGPIEVTCAAWRRWLAASARPDVTCTASSLRPIARVLAARLAADRDLVLDALTFLAERSGRSGTSIRELHARVQAGSAMDWQLFFKGLLAAGARPATVAVCEHLIERQWVQPEVGDGLADDLNRALADADGPPWGRVITELAAVVPSREVPGLLLIPSADDDRHSERRDERLTEWLIEATSAAIHLARLATGIPVAVAVDRETFARFDHATTESHAKEILRDGLVDVFETRTHDLGGQLDEAGLGDDRQLRRSLQRIIADGAPDALIEAFVAAARAVNRAERAARTPSATERAADDTRTADDARAAAEQFLFARLESLPDTSGVFARDRSIAIEGASAEASGGAIAAPIACSRLRVAVFVDARPYAPDDYRAARAADIGLQRRGFLVVRFLAADVVGRLGWVLDQLTDVLAFARHRRRLSQTQRL